MHRWPSARDVGARLPPPWVLLGLSATVQLILAFAFFGGGVDVVNFGHVALALSLDPLHVYSLNDGSVSAAAYPPAFFAWLLPAFELTRATGIPFHGLLHLPLIAATLGLALLVHRFLLRSGKDEAEARVGLGCVALGPLFLQVSGWHGQLEALAFLPAFAGVAVWTGGGDRRWLWAGALIGAGAAVKTVPILLLPALWPTARNVREAISLTAVAGAIPALLLLPFYLHEPDGVREILGYAGIAGAGGLSLIVQPELAEPWVWARPLDTVPWSGAQESLQDAGRYIIGAGLLAVTAILLRRRVEPLPAACAVMLVVYAASANLFAYYLLWIVPFLVAAGRYRAAVGVQVVATLAQVLIHFGEDVHGLVVPYVVLMIGVTLASAAAAVTLLLRLRTGRPATR